jgi:hypothetical protein
LFVGLGEAFEREELGAPHGLEVLGERPEGGFVGDVEVLSSLLSHRDESGVAEDAEVLRDGAEGDVDVGGDVAGGSFLVPDELEDFLSPGLGDGGEGLGHPNILAITKIKRKAQQPRSLASLGMTNELR